MSTIPSHSVTCRTTTERAHRAEITLLLGSLVVLYAMARVMQAFPDEIPMGVIVATHVLLPLVFSFIHSVLFYGRRATLIFALFSLVVGNSLENLSILTGFPFGRYHFTDVMGPKLFHVPIMLGFAYVGMGYLSWIIGSLILGDIENPLRGSGLWLKNSLESTEPRSLSLLIVSQRWRLRKLPRNVQIGIPGLQFFVDSGKLRVTAFRSGEGAKL